MGLQRARSTVSKSLHWKNLIQTNLLYIFCQIPFIFRINLKLKYNLSEIKIE